MHVRFKPGWHRTYPELTGGNRYRVIEICVDSYRVIDDLGDACLYPQRAFETADAPMPATWQQHLVDGALYAGPHELSELGPFWERWHDGDAATRSHLARYLRELCHAEAGAQPSLNGFSRIALPATHGAGPVIVYREVDADRWEVRKVEAFADGRLTYAGVRFGTSGTTVNADQPIDPLAGAPSAITADEFEVIWDRALDADESLAHE